MLLALVKDVEYDGRGTTNPVSLDEVYRFYVDAHDSPSTRCIPMTEADSSTSVTRTCSRRGGECSWRSLWSGTARDEEFGNIRDVTDENIHRILPVDGFGKFAALLVSKDSFIQVSNDWQPGPECEAFVRVRGSDPWLLEYRDGGQAKRPATRSLRMRAVSTSEAHRMHSSGLSLFRLRLLGLLAAVAGDETA